MPGLSGADVQRELNSANVRVPVVIMTAYDSLDVREECMRLGALAFLSKPIETSLLLDAVAAAFTRQRVDIPIERAIVGGESVSPFREVEPEI